MLSAIGDGPNQIGVERGRAQELRGVDGGVGRRVPFIRVSEASTKVALLPD